MSRSFDHHQGVFRNIQIVVDKSDFIEELKNSIMVVEWPKHVGVFL